MKRSFSSKILWFGEYTVINGSAALAVPFPSFNGRWEANARGKHDWNPLLRFLQARPHLLDLPRLEADLETGFGFNSLIPEGKGLGSSGALVAALFAEYAPKTDLPLQAVRERLAELECHYHGQSSGLDPLVSYVDKPMLLRGTDTPKIGEFPLADWTRTQRWFLLDSGVSRHSAPLLAVFKQKCARAEFTQALKELEGIVGECIEDLRNLDEAHMGLHMEELSRLQLSLFSEMIPPKLRAVWEQGLDRREFALKLCGAGGGGYFIGYKLRGPYLGNVLLF